MKSRCRIKENPAHRSYDSYKHVTLCKEWEDYLVFREWALTHGYAPGLWLDREDNSLGYHPNNCHWVTPEKSNKNTRWTRKRQKNLESATKKRRIPIICLDTGECFTSMAEAAYAYKTHESNIYQAMARNGKAKGKRWARKIT
jgi:hypothetical protein